MSSSQIEFQREELNIDTDDNVVVDDDDVQLIFCDVDDDDDDENKDGKSSGQIDQAVQRGEH